MVSINTFVSAFDEIGIPYKKVKDPLFTELTTPFFCLTLEKTDAGINVIVCLKDGLLDLNRVEKTYSLSTETQIDFFLWKYKEVETLLKEFIL